MSFVDLRAFIRHLEARGELVRITEEVSVEQEITVIQHRVLAQGGPALLFENVKESPYKIVSNLYGTKKRVDMVFGQPPGEMGEKLVSLVHELMPPSLGRLWGRRRDLGWLLKSRLRDVGSGPILEETFEPPDLMKLPVLKCWPKDGGPFFTLPLVHTRDPENGVGNLGIYRLQRFNALSTGMHWQIEKGGGFHFQKAIERGEPLPISVLLGGPPALTIAAIMPLPEGVDERLIAALMLGQPLDMIKRSTTGHRIPAHSEFLLEGTVRDGDMQHEGPFGDHLGHYSHSADFPVFRVERMLARKGAIYPATVVGKPKQEDYFIGESLQEMTLPLLRMIHPGILDLWAYPETGFHPLAVAKVKERYPREALKQAFSMLGEGQMSLTKVMIVVDGDVNIKDFREVSNALWAKLTAESGVYLIAATAQDTLDFTGPSINHGSRLILVATGKEELKDRRNPPPDPPRPAEVHQGIIQMTRLGHAILFAQLKRGADKEAVRKALAAHPLTSQYLFQVLVSDDVPLDDPILILWGWFTRFDPLADLHPARREIEGNRLLLNFPIAIDATWKEGYREPVAFDPQWEELVEKKWERYGIQLP